MSGSGGLSGFENPDVQASMNISDLTTRSSRANRVTWVGFYVNLVLTAFKLAAGVAGHSAAMIADAIHSLSDFATDIVVLVSFRIIGKPADRSHKYGHGKFETLATALIGLALLLVGAGILGSGAKRIWSDFYGADDRAPGWIAFVAAILSIVSKEWLYRYTVRAGNAIQSPAVIANAWHHRSDAFSSIGTALGIGGAILLGPRWRLLDPLAAVIVSFFILKISVELTWNSLRELTESALDRGLEDEILAVVRGVPGAQDPHDLRTRRIGANVAIDLHLNVQSDLTVKSGHAIADRVEDTLRARFGSGAYISIHVEPAP